MSNVDTKNCRKILHCIIASTITEDNSRIPSAKEYILHSFTHGTIIYMKGDTEKISKITSREGLVRRVHTAFVSELEKHGETLDPQIREIVEQLTNPENIDPGGPAKTYDTCELYELFRGRNQGVAPGIRPLMCIGRTFSPEHQWLQYVRKERIPSLSETELRDVQGIAQEMRKLWDRS